MKVDFWHDWDSLVGLDKLNWYNFTFIKLYTEYDARFGNFELEFSLLGLNFRFVQKVAEGDVEFQEYLADMVKRITEDE